MAIFQDVRLADELEDGNARKGWFMDNRREEFENFVSDFSDMNAAVNQVYVEMFEHA